MRLEYQIIVALLLDFAFGNPRWLPNPASIIGRLVTALEEATRRSMTDLRLAGSLTALAVVLTVTLATGAMIGIAEGIHPAVGDAVSIFLIYTTFTASDLSRRSRGVYRALAGFDLTEARRLVSWMVGRDTKRLAEPEVVRAAIESLAENTVDGIIAPLFFAVLGGPVAAMAYKAVSTLDSMIGYRNERYIDFGRTAAQIDDGANWLPVRLAIPIITAAAALTGQQAAAAWRIARRDGRKQLSPNAGIAEAAFAGALGIRLGGIMQRRGRPGKLPEVGDPVVTLARGQILAANRLMVAALGVASALFLTVHWGITALIKP